MKDLRNAAVLNVLILFACFGAIFYLSETYKKQISTAAIIEVDSKTYRCIPVKVVTSVEDME